MTGSSTQGIKKTVLHPVSDLAKAHEVYAALLGFEAAGRHIGLVPGGGPDDGNVLGLLQDR